MPIGPDQGNRFNGTATTMKFRFDRRRETPTGTRASRRGQSVTFAAVVVLAGRVATSVTS